MDNSEVRRIASAHGLTKLTGADLERLAAAIKNNERLVAGLPRNLHWSEEPAHILRLAGAKEAAR